MNKSKLTPYRLPVAIFVFFIIYTLFAHTFLSAIPKLTSELIHHYYGAFDVLKETEQVAIMYAILSGVFAYFFWGKLMKIEASENRKTLLKGIGGVVLIIAAYGYSLVQQA
ncbi:hypothetical protein [Psychromonas aquatilis]|uniref:Uncharacterized protein n=1 Tax=Psychromonas aquatilis TaxID=2005072 RepID=A0ABU9GNX2_9GAMM